MQAFIIDLALKATVLVGVAALVVTLLRRHSAAARHLVWTLCVAAIVAVPVLAAVVPAWRVPGVSLLTKPTFRFDVETWPARVAEPRPARTTPDPIAVLAETAREMEQPIAASPERVVPTATKEPAARIDVSIRPDWTVWLPVAWLGGAVVVLVTIATGLARTTWLTRRPGPGAPGTVQRAAARARQRLGIRRDVTVIVAEDQVMPMTWGAVRPVVLLPAEADTWPADRLHAVLMHEFAHVRRYDFVTQLVARVACALCWFNPLVWLAARRLRVERELACDDLVLAAGSRPSDYAQQLLDIARSLRPRPLTAVATVAMARPSQLAGRLLAVLDAGRSRAGVTRRAVLAAVVIAGLVVVPMAGASPWREADDEGSAVSSVNEAEAVETEAVAGGFRRSVDASATARNRLEPPVTAPTRPQPPVTAQQCSWLTGEHTSASTNVNDDRTRIRIEMDGCRIDLDVEGEVRFADDFTDVARLDRDGRFEIEERNGRERRRVELRAANGTIERRWWVNGDQRPYDAEASAWLTRTLTVVFRRTGFHAKERADWVFRTQGLEGLLAEIDSISSDYAAGRYYQVVLAQPNLDGNTVQNLVRQAGARIDSDHTLGQILLAVAEHQTVDENVRVAYVEAARSIESDFTKRRVLSAILQREGLETDLAAEMLRQATQLDSDHELGRLLEELIAAYPIDQTLTPLFFQAVSGIDSDFTRRSVLEALLEKGAPNQDVLDRTLEATNGMDSDHEVGRVLLGVAELYPVDQGLPASYVRAAQGLDSDFTQRQVWLALVERQSLPAATLSQVLDAAASMDSDHERGTVLRGVLETHGVPAAARPAFFRAIGRLDSDFERGRVLRDVIDRKPVDRATVLAAVEAGKGIDSDHELGRFIMHVTDNVPLDDELRGALRGAADAIDSEHTRGQVLAKLYPRTSQ